MIQQRRILVLVGGAVALAVLAVLLLLLRPPTDQPLDWVVLGGRNYQPTEILSDSPLVVRVEPPPPPRFDTAPLGPELEMERGPLPEPLPPEVTAAEQSVFLGYFGGTPGFVIPGDFGSFSRLLDFVTDFSADGVVCVVIGNDPRGNSQSCLNADGQLPTSGTTSHLDTDTGERHTVFLVSLLPPTTSVVGLRLDGEPFGWQRPIASSALISVLDARVVSLRWRAFDANGRPLGP